MKAARGSICVVRSFIPGNKPGTKIQVMIPMRGRLARRKENKGKILKFSKGALIKSTAFFMKNPNIMIEINKMIIIPVSGQKVLGRKLKRERK